MKYQKVLSWSVIISMGGFLFGLDTAVISGCEQTIQNLWSLSDAMTGQMVAMALYGTIAGAMTGGIPAESLGRKKALYIVAVIYLVAALGCALAQDVWTLMAFRFLGGLSVGASSVIAPMYIAELAPREKRGQLTALFQFNIVFGILIAYFSNYLIGVSHPDAWRWMLGIVAIPSMIFLVAIYFIPESPRWLVTRKNHTKEALAILRTIDPTTADVLLEDIHSAHTEKHQSAGLGSFFSAAYLKPILLAFLIAFFNQLSGINAVIYYAPRILKDTGLAESAALLSTAGIGLINLIFTMLGLSLIDRYGRKFLMYIGSIGYILSLTAVALVFLTKGSGTWIPVWLFVFIAAHAIGQGAVIWVFISEIFPTSVRSWGNSFGSTVHWVFAALIAGIFPIVNAAWGGGIIFLFFAGMMVLQLLFVWKMMPETRGVSLEALERKLTSHI